MDAVEHQAYCEDVQLRVERLLRERYGRRARSRPAGTGLDVIEAGYATIGAYWQLAQILDDAGTSFETMRQLVRYDVLMADLLTFPAERASADWAKLYGYGSVGSLSRAFRKWYGVGIADARRVGTLGLWLQLADRRPRTERGTARVQEAQARIASFSGTVRNLGPEGRTALRRLGRSRGESDTGRRPRYPAVGSTEAMRLEVHAK